MNEMGTERPAPAGGGKLIVITAPLTEIIDHAGYFIQMSMASLPMWLEGILNKKYPQWRNLEYNDDGTARYMRCRKLRITRSHESSTRALWRMTATD